jgi:hypothetical protein
MDNFDLKQFLTENKLTTNSKILSEIKVNKPASFNLERGDDNNIYFTFPSFIKGNRKGIQLYYDDGDLYAYISKTYMSSTKEIFDELNIKYELKTMGENPYDPSYQFLITNPERFNIPPEIEGFDYDAWEEEHGGDFDY